MCEVKELTKGARARHSRSDDNQELIEFPTLICIRIKSNTCGLELEGLQERPLPHSPLPSPLSSRLAFALVEFQQFGSLARQRRQNTISLHSPLPAVPLRAERRHGCRGRDRALPSLLPSFSSPTPISLAKLQFPRLPALPAPSFG